VIERINAPGLIDPPGYSHAVVASGERLVVTAGAVPEVEAIAVTG
jgi:hypothetical protein